MNKTLLVIATIVGSTAFMPVASVMATGNTTPTPTPTKTPTPTTTPTPTMTPEPTQAVQSCQTVYGGGSTCETTELILDKTVRHPESDIFVDNLGVNDPKYSPDGTVSFKIKVTNTGTSDFEKVTITDTLPDFVKFTDGDAKTHTFTLDNLKAGESRTIDVSTKIVNAQSLPGDQGITCIINTAKATNNSIEASDTATFCVEKTVLGITKGGNVVHPVPTAKTTPPTGPEALALMGLIPTGVIGFFLRKKALHN